VSRTGTSKAPQQEQAAQPSKRVVFTMGGKGGVGKTGFMLALTEWFEANGIPFTLLDLDTENKARGSLKHYFGGAARKVNIHTPAGLDTFIDHLAEGAPIILADMGAGSGQVAHEWFDAMYDDVAEQGIAFTAIGIVTADPASVESVLSWASRLQDRASYVIVENASAPQADFSYWRDSDQAQRFREAFEPVTIAMEFRLADLENPARQHGVTLGQIAERKTQVAELQKASLVMRAQSYRRRLFQEFEKAKELLLP
jgi:MinD-like ATPase involved in chromosome partitioning or flagellar assembly